MERHFTVSMPFGEGSRCARERVRMPLLSESLCELTRADVEGCRGSTGAWGVSCFAVGGSGVTGGGAGASSAANVASIVYSWSCFLDLALHKHLYFTQ